MSEASSTVFAPSRALKRNRGDSPNSAHVASIMEDERSAARSEPKHRRKRGRPKTPNIVDVIREREREREERKKEREEWEERRMADTNLIIPPAAKLSAVEDVMEELGDQPTPDITSELMQAVCTIEKVATTAKNLKDQY